MDRWNSEKCAFTLPPGEITITLLDVALILGLPVTGNPVILREDAPFSDLEREYGAVLWNRKITVAALEERLESFGDADDEDFTRTFLLFTFGTLLFPNSNGKVDSRFLFLLQDLSKVSQFAWGAAVLEDLFNWLCKRKEMNVQYVGGCLILLQIWLYEHVDVACPNLVECSLKFPRVCRWGNSRSHHRQWLKFKELEANQILWKLELTAEESEMEIVKEFLVTQSERTGHHVDQNCSPDDSLNGSDMTINYGSSEQKVISDNESEVVIAGDVCETEERFSNQLSIVSTDHIDYQKDMMEHRRTLPSNFTAIIVSDDDKDDLGDSRILEKQNVELKEEIYNLKKEIEFLNNKLICSSMVEDQNVKLRKEVENLRHENQVLMSSTQNLVGRLESIVFEGHGVGIEDQRIE
ncbi:PMD domain-containing protein [Abeliophyllum distichum]|uniref:PMD domain-containing protein n=1 Tax=Abeliophyllum distichum TaxID=126358 RepID=A0ABD1QUZ8_9LAMI